VEAKTFASQLLHVGVSVVFTDDRAAEQVFQDVLGDDASRVAGFVQHHRQVVMCARSCFASAGSDNLPATAGFQT
jgi:hypothetical protein